MFGSPSPYQIHLELSESPMGSLSQGCIIIEKSINLIGENRETTILNCPHNINEYYGIILRTNYINISNFTISGNFQPQSIGILDDTINEAKNNINIENCTVHSFADGIAFYNTINCTVRNCIVYDTFRRGGINTFGGGGNEFIDCTSYSNNYGIYISNSNFNTISNCVVYNNSIDGILIYTNKFESANNNKIVDCDVFNNHNYGVLITYEDVPSWALETDIINCRIYNNSNWGIGMEHSNYGEGSDILDCEIFNNVGGMRVYGYETLIANNYCYDNNGDGIWAYHQEITITNCTVENNSGCGINLSSAENQNNIVYHNNLINNDINAFSNGISNTWDNGYPSGGNYWPDYIGDDSDGDGIGDILYNISGGSNQDLYPLIVPYGPPFARIRFTTNNNTVFFNSSYSFDYDGTIESYDWDFGDGYYSTVPNPIHTYYDDGDYNITLMVTDNDGKNHTTYFWLTVHTNTLTSGWDLITVPAEMDWWASDVTNNLTGCTIVSKWNSSMQTYDTYIVGGPPTFDFAIEGGCGYFVDMTSSDNLTMCGLITDNVNIELDIGWNLLGWYHEYDTTASSLSENITECLSVSMWNATMQTYDTYIIGGPPTFDFIVTRGMGLFVDVTKESVWHGEG